MGGRSARVVRFSASGREDAIPAVVAPASEGPEMPMPAVGTMSPRMEVCRQDRARPDRPLCSRLVGAAMFFLVVAATVVLAGAAQAEDPVLVNITGPLAAKLGEKVSFEVELVNRSGRPLTGLRVVDYFDRGFHHEASASPIEQRGTIDMAAGTSRRLTLEFFTDEPGRQCHRVEILDQAHTFMGGATECVMVTAPTAPAVAGAPAMAAPTVAAPLQAGPPAVAVPPGVTLPPAIAVPPSVAAPAPVIAPPVAAAPVPRPAVPVPVPVPAAPPVVAPSRPALPQPATSSVVQPTMSQSLPTAAIPALPAAPAAAAVPAIELDMSGPNELMDGGVGEFVATVRNTGLVASGPTKLEFDWDPTYAALEASDGYLLGTNSVSWTLPPIEPGGQLRRQINLRAQSPAGVRGGQASRACVRGVLAESVGGVMVADESCVIVRSSAPALRTPREAGLRLSVADCADPVQVGGSTTVVCTVTNNGGAASGRLRVVLSIPEEARLVGDPTPSKVSIEGRTLTFDGIGSIPPGGRATFEATYRLPAGAPASRATAVASLSGEQLDGRVESECTTTFLGL